MTFAWLLEGFPANVNVNEGSTAKLIKHASEQHEIESACGWQSASREVRWVRDEQAIQARERRLAANVYPFKKVKAS